ncbi:helix-turn-helix domain-containing protein [Paenimyroides aestuarii]|uniref:Helix-turn-helix domain-containing protein n=1 Tax=Paenimyroides aestuarii TaxID=2968490 RepID=A0ABY5NUT0_9FLAO|nr:helix-turn-helix transcriptional regulator [Paenimyroides aestuarii]UUV22109.1 helix-turn-helix domain-containing protein [Paenimyroides aestuarii]
MSKIGYNIKKLRNVKNLSQQAFAELFSLTRGNISSYEEQRAEPKLESVIKIANYFSIPLEHLLTKQLSVNEILNFNDYFKEESQKKLQKNFTNIPFISREAIHHIKEGTFDMQRLELITFPMYSSNKFIALEFTHEIAAPASMNMPEYTILFFEQVQIDTLHTLNNQYGMFLTSNEIFIGTYNQNQSTINLKLNEWKSEDFNTENLQSFWKLYAKFEKKI